MTEKMRNDPKVKEAEDFLKRWMSLTPMKKERAKGYLECLEGTEQYQQPQKTAQQITNKSRKEGENYGKDYIKFKNWRSIVKR